MDLAGVRNSTSVVCERRDGILPVSYTHLDVYKRQLVDSDLLVFITRQQSSRWEMRFVRGIRETLCFKADSASCRECSLSLIHISAFGVVKSIGVSFTEAISPVVIKVLSTGV